MLKSPEHRQYRGHSLLGTGTSLCPSLPRAEPPWLLTEARGTCIPNPHPTQPRTRAPVMTSGLPPRPHSDGGCPDSVPRPWTSPPQGVTGRKSRAHPPPPHPTPPGRVSAHRTRGDITAGLQFRVSGVTVNHDPLEVKLGGEARSEDEFWGAQNPDFPLVSGRPRSGIWPTSSLGSCMVV